MSSERRAMVIGCTGVAGSALISHLISGSEKHGTWAEIIGLSRGHATRLEMTKRSKTSSFVVRFIAADLAEEDVNVLTQQIGSDILNRISHIFFCVWVPSPAGAGDTEYKLNNKLLENLLNVTINARKSASLPYPRLLLLEGTKSYGIHLGPKRFQDYKVPFDEDSYVRHPNPPNFYFGWEDELKKRHWPEWIALRPGPIVGVSVQRSSFFNFGTGLAVFLTLLKTLNKTMIFPDPLDGSPKSVSLQSNNEFVDSKIVAAQLEWTALLPSDLIKSPTLLDCYQVPALNCSNGETHKWADLWPKLARSLGLVSSLEEPFNFLQFFEARETKETWAKLVDQYGLVSPKSLGDVAVWPAIGATLTRSYDCFSTMAKTRRLGFAQTTSTLNMLLSTFKDLQINNVIPPILID